jgi:predicted DNA-binding transcriptional regulator YafY
MDILKHGAHVKIVEPDALRQAAIDELARARAQYKAMGNME